MTELLKIHKVKLLEMCKELFPEYPDVQFGVKEKHNWSKDYLVFGLIDDEPIVHWFEFCWTNLIQKIYKENTPMERVNNINNFALICYNDFELNHPIDYLYEEFKKLK
jgi:hypothetical protein